MAEFTAVRTMRRPALRVSSSRACERLTDAESLRHGRRDRPKWISGAARFGDRHQRCPSSNPLTLSSPPQGAAVDVGIAKRDLPMVRCSGSLVGPPT